MIDTEGSDSDEDGMGDAHSRPDPTSLSGNEQLLYTRGVPSKHFTLVLQVCTHLLLSSVTEIEVMAELGHKAPHHGLLQTVILVTTSLPDSTCNNPLFTTS